MVSLWDPPVSSPSIKVLGKPPLIFDMDSGDPNAGPHSCAASILPTELSPQPLRILEGLISPEEKTSEAVKIGF